MMNLRRCLMISKKMKVWTKYNIPPDISLTYIEMKEKDKENARIYLELAVRNNPLRRYENISQTVLEIMDILE